MRKGRRYHTGGAPIVGARVLVRPAWHWDWTSEHVYGAAAPDPYAPKTGLGRIVRVSSALPPWF